jgi:glycolate dehydrogenase iron-sulfur subunit
MDCLFGHVHAATRRTLAANGYEVLENSLPDCCGALHLHAGDRRSAQSLARSNIAALVARVDYIVVNSAGCGAMLKQYGHLVDSPAAATFSAKVRDVAELLVQAGPRQGGPLGLNIVYDAPCHLQHAQRIHQEVLTLLDAIPDARLALLPGFDRCCGSAGIYSMLQPAMSRAVLDAKIASIAQALPRPDVVVTGNPGCLMQIGAGLLAAGLEIPVAHPVELLDRSYQLAGYYRATGSS